MRRFNVTGLCVPDKDYMVDISDKVSKITELVDRGSYFTINRARQYGKTTTLSRLEQELADSYICASISFEATDDKDFETPEAFCSMFVQETSRALKFASVTEEYATAWLDTTAADFRTLGAHIANMCKDKKVVLIIDEVDKTSNTRVLLSFLDMLRAKYLSAKNNKDHTFHSVILAGVTNIKNLKLKMINDGICMPYATEGRIYNSPWNIAADFAVDMSFSPAEIATMLIDYENDYHIGMDIAMIADAIYEYTCGYPFLVSRICQCIDEEAEKDWTIKGIQRAVKIILQERNMLFDDMAKSLENNEKIYDLLYAVLIIGEQRAYMHDNPVIEWCSMFGYIKRGDGAHDAEAPGHVAISNKIFEMRLSNYFSSKDENVSRINNAFSKSLYNDIVQNGMFDMELCLRKFSEHYRELYAEADAPFLERHGRLLFLSYLRPLVNGQGFYHIESQFTDLKRMDVVVDFGADQFIIELKIWRGEAARGKAHEQLLEYMDAKRTNRGYLLIFDFREQENRERRAEWVSVGNGKMIFEAIV